jgi:hypothetical protein
MLTGQQGDRECCLSPCRRQLLVPAKSTIETRYRDGRLYFGFDFPGAPDRLRLQESAADLPVSLHVGYVGQRLGLAADRLRTRMWSTYAFEDKSPSLSVEPLGEMDLSPESNWLRGQFDDSSDGVIARDLDSLWPMRSIANCRYIHLPSSIFRDLKRSQPETNWPSLFWLWVLWPEADPSAILSDKVQLNVVPYCDRVFWRADPQAVSWVDDNTIGLKPDTRFRSIKQSVTALLAQHSDGSFFYDRRSSLSHELSTFRVIGNEDGRYLRRLVFGGDRKVKKKIRLWVCYHPIEEPFPNGEPVRLDPEVSSPSAGIVIETAQLLGDPRHGWNRLSLSDAWVSFVSLLTARSRCVTRADVRALLRTFDLFGLSEHIDHKCIEFRQAYRRDRGALVPCTDVIIRLLAKDELRDLGREALSALDLQAAGRLLEEYLEERSGFPARLRVRLISQE